MKNKCISFLFIICLLMQILFVTQFSFSKRETKEIESNNLVYFNGTGKTLYNYLKENAISTDKEANIAYGKPTQAVKNYKELGFSEETGKQVLSFEKFAVYTPSWYFSYASSYTFDKEKGQYTLTSPQVVQYSAGYSNLIGKYVTSYYGKQNNQVVSTSSTIYQIVDATYDTVKKEGIITYKTSRKEPDEYINNGKGIYQIEETKNDTYPVYFYRGDVNNNLIFAGNCYKIMRTTELGGTRIIYVGKTSEGTCENPVLDEGIKGVPYNAMLGSIEAGTVGYMYGHLGAYSYEEEHANENDSNAKRVLDKWYEDNLLGTGYDEWLEDSIYCNDRSVLEGEPFGGKVGTFSGFNRLARTGEEKETKPTLVCSNENDRFTVSKKNGNGALTYPIALPTMDESIYAGSSSYSSYDYYLANYHFYTMTPAKYEGNGSNFINWVYLYPSGLHTTYYDLLPVVSLDKRVTIKGGEGTAESPFIIDNTNYSVETSVKGENGKISNSSYTISAGTDFEITINPDVEYEVKQLLINGIDKKNEMINNKFVIKNIDANYQVEVEFQKSEQEMIIGNGLYNLLQNSSLGKDRYFDWDNTSLVKETGVFTAYRTENDKYPVYYYRGDISNNNLLFAGFCWKIIRTTETGGTKLLYAGVVGENNTCKNEGDNLSIGLTKYNEPIVYEENGQIKSKSANAFAGYMYGKLHADSYEEEHENKNNSTLKEKIDTWYEENLKETEFASMIEDTIYCNDRSVNHQQYASYFKFDDNGNTIRVEDTLGKGFGNMDYALTGYGAVTRIYHDSAGRKYYAKASASEPSFICRNKNDRFTVSSEIGNGALTYPIATITVDEALYAGIGSGNSTFLKNYVRTWTMTPTYGDNKSVDLFILYSGTITNISNSNWDGRISPVLSLNQNTMIIGGDGSEDNPYQVGSSYRIETSIKEGKGWVTPTIPFAPKGNDYTIEVHPEKGYEIEEFLVNGENKIKDLKENQYKIENISQNYTIVVSFRNPNEIKNPPTGAGIKYMLLVLIIGGILFAVKSKRNSPLKKI